MISTQLDAISPIDGRYHLHCKELSAYFSEFALIKYRVWVEVEYFIALSKLNLNNLGEISNVQQEELRKLPSEFNIADATRIKEIEATTNHDVKAVEYFLKEKMAALGLEAKTEFIHFALTSQDINNTATPLMLNHFIQQHYFPQITSLMGLLDSLSMEWQDIPMLSRTHGQPASPTRLGKEIYVYKARLQNQLEQLKNARHAAKFGGATGNFNAHHVAYPDIDWEKFADDFIASLGLYRLPYTTQIEWYDDMAAIFDNMARMNTILIDFCRDVWTYISLNYFIQETKAGEVGSSAMPHKVNPIDFENAEGNLGLANALLNFFSSKLPVSRLQRDLTDSTVLRNIGVPMAHTYISVKSIVRGLGKLKVNQTRIAQDLEANWAVVAEAIQTILRSEGYPQPYEALKQLTRGHQDINEASIKNFIQSLDVSDNIKNRLLHLTPFNYVGVFTKKEL
ncbi:MAG: adenylosuccinate lyase [Bacteroidetes bacterium]|nr:adenylosuccinate lyase [Bacteroidota bacterium]